MKKIYTTPALDVVSLNCDDIVTASGESVVFGNENDYASSADAKRRTDIWGEDE